MLNLGSFVLHLPTNQKMTTFLIINLPLLKVLGEKMIMKCFGGF
jgi:hypothetical protein